MLYSRLADVYERLEGTTKKLEKRDILAELYKSCGKQDLYHVVLLSIGTVFPTGEYDLGIASSTMKKVIAKAYGVSEKEINAKFKVAGDLGTTAEFFSSSRRQHSLISRELTIQHVFDNLQKLPGVVGDGSVERKITLVAELLSAARPKEARYIVRTTLMNMRIGVAEGVVRNAIAKAFGKEPKELEKVYDILGDYGTVAELASKDELRADVIVGRPLRVMLADRAENLKEALGTFDRPAIETKYDGFRLQIHKDGSSLRLFSRRLDEVTNQFPDIVALAKECISAKSCIVEGEVVAVDSRGNPLPFQRLSRRIQRKYEIEKTVREIPVQVNLFELIYLNGKNLMSRPLHERWNELQKIISVKKNVFQFAQHIETKNLAEAEKFYNRSLEMGEEGVIVKNMEAHYQPGKRVGFWLKVKPIMEPLDLVVVGAEWGEGKKARWLSSLLLAARRGQELVETGKMASGFTESQLEELTPKLRKLILEEHGKQVKIKPKIIIEVGYEEIQKSPKYPSGYALRFPRLLRVRNDKDIEEINTAKDIERLFAQQKKRK